MEARLSNLNYSEVGKINYENFRFEFILGINENIICQRFFDIRGYNDKVLKSLDLKILIDDCVDLIKDYLKKRTSEQLWKYFNPYVEQTKEDIEKTKVINDKEYYFTFEIKVDRKTVIKSYFGANVYPSSVRFQVDITDLIPEIISMIRYVFTQKKFEMINDYK